MCRLPHNDFLRPHAVVLMQAALNVLNTDNEENGLLCLRITFDLHKAFRPNLEELVPPFMEFVKKAGAHLKMTFVVCFHYRFLPACVLMSCNVCHACWLDLQVFEGVSASYKNYFEPGPEGRQMQDIIPTTQSFKIVAETPIQGGHVHYLGPPSINDS